MLFHVAKLGFKINFIVRRSSVFFSSGDRLTGFVYISFYFIFTDSLVYSIKMY